MSQVDPYIVKIPQAFAKDPELQAWYTYTNRFLHDLWRGLTGGTGDTEVVETAPYQTLLSQVNNINGELAKLKENLGDVEKQQIVKHEIEQLKKTIDRLPRQDAIHDLKQIRRDFERIAFNSLGAQKKFNNISISSAYNAVDHDFITATSSAVIALPQYPIKDSIIIITNNDGSLIEVDGNGKNISSSSSVFIHQKGDSIELQYNLDEWRIK